MKIGIIGAAGKVGKQVIQNLVLDADCSDLDLVLIGKNPDKVLGALEDIRSSLPLRDFFNGQYEAPKVAVSDELSDLKDCAIVVVLAGLWPSTDQKEEFKKIDPSGRLIQSYTNLPLINNLAKQIEEYVPEAIVLIGTNQSDMMTEAFRRTFPKGNVLGFGGIVDSMRLRTLMQKVIESDLVTPQGHIIGYHNEDMIVLSDSTESILEAGIISKLIEKTRSYGADVSRLQKDFNFPSINSGASVLPGLAMAKTIKAFSGKTEMEESFNVLLDEEAARIYGTMPGRALSVPIKIKHGRYEIVKSYKVSSQEKDHLRNAQERFYLSCGALFAANQNIRIMQEFHIPKNDKI